MKKILSILGICLISSNVYATDMTAKKFYIGADYQHTKNDYDSSREYADNLRSGNINLGIRTNKFFGIELGYFQAKERKNPKGEVVISNPYQYTLEPNYIKTKGLSLDFIGYLPVEKRGLDIFGTLGAGFYKNTVKYRHYEIVNNVVTHSYYAKNKLNETVLRVGGGVQKSINEYLSLRGGMRFDKPLSGDNLRENAIIANVGIRFHF